MFSSRSTPVKQAAQAAQADDEQKDEEREAMKSRRKQDNVKFNMSLSNQSDFSEDQVAKMVEAAAEFALKEAEKVLAYYRESRGPKAIDHDSIRKAALFWMSTKPENANKVLGFQFVFDTTNGIRSVFGDDLWTGSGITGIRGSRSPRSYLNALPELQLMFWAVMGIVYNGKAKRTVHWAEIFAAEPEDEDAQKVWEDAKVRLELKRNVRIRRAQSNGYKVPPEFNAENTKKAFDQLRDAFKKLPEPTASKARKNIEAALDSGGNPKSN